MFKISLNLIVSIILSFISVTCFSNEIYKSIDNDGNITFSSIAPLNDKIIKTVNVDKLIKKISVINGASEQNKKIIAITKKLTESRIQRNKKTQNSTENYNKEIVLIKNQRLEGLKNLNDEQSALNSNISNSQQLKNSISRMLENQE